MDGLWSAAVLICPCQLHRQFAIAQYLYANISDEDKEKLLFHPDTGRWAGYKHPYGFKVGPLGSVVYPWTHNDQRERGPRDGIEQFNWYRREWEDDSCLPKCILPLMDEIRAFAEVSTA